MSAATTTDTASATMRDAALWFARQGFPVFPLHDVSGGRCSCGKRDCNAPGKHPRPRNGFKDATRNFEEISGWWERWPDANIGLPTGSASGLLVVDLDPRNGGPVDRDSFVEEYGALPDTAEVITGGGGRHFYFRDPGGRVPKALGPGVDVKGEGGYVVAPPSIHQSGARYEFEGAEGARTLLSVAEVPAWLRGRLAAQNGDPRGESREPAEVIPEGGRNNALASIAGRMRAGGLSESAIAAALLEENRARCNPPLPEDEVRRIAASIGRYEPGPMIAPARRDAGICVDAVRNPGEAIVAMNLLPVFAGLIRWQQWKRRGKTLIGISEDGEEIRIEAAKLLTFAAFQNEVFTVTGTVLPNPKRGETRTVWHTAAQLIHRAAAGDARDTGNPEDDLKADLLRCWRSAGEPIIPRGGIGPLIRGLLAYRRNPYADEAPQAVFRIGDEAFVHPEVFRAWLSTPAGAARHVPLKEIRDGLAMLEFEPRKLDTDHDGARLTLNCWAAGEGVLFDE